MLAQGSRNIGFMDFKGLTTPEHFIAMFNQGARNGRGRAKSPASLFREGVAVFESVDECEGL
jgi:hypothetical protein